MDLDGTKIMVADDDRVVRRIVSVKLSGLGCEIDWATVEKLKGPKPPRRPEPERLIETTWPNGRKMYIANNGKVNFMLTAGQRGQIPYFERGVFTKLKPNDGSPEWGELYTRARKEPVLIDA